MSSNWPFSGHLPLCLDKIAFDWTNCLISYKKNKWPSGYLISLKWACGCVRRAIFSGHNSQLAVQILFCPDVSAQKLFRALVCVYVHVYDISISILGSTVN